MDTRLSTRLSASTACASTSSCSFAGRSAGSDLRTSLSLSLPSRSIETLANLTTLAEDPYGYINNTQYGQDLEPWQRAAVDALKPHVKDI